MFRPPLRLQDGPGLAKRRQLDAQRPTPRAAKAHNGTQMYMPYLPSPIGLFTLSNKP